jgi:hypothetical protein
VSAYVDENCVFSSCRIAKTINQITALFAMEAFCDKINAQLADGKREIAVQFPVDMGVYQRSEVTYLFRELGYCANSRAGMLVIRRKPTLLTLLTSEDPKSKISSLIVIILMLIAFGNLLYFIKHAI